MRKKKSKKKSLGFKGIRFTFGRARNGWTIRVERSPMYAVDGDDYESDTIVMDEGEDKLTACRALFYSIMEEIGLVSNKYDDKTLVISVLPGHSNEQPIVDKEYLEDVKDLYMRAHAALKVSQALPSDGEIHYE